MTLVTPSEVARRVALTHGQGLRYSLLSETKCPNLRAHCFGQSLCLASLDRAGCPIPPNMRGRNLGLRLARPVTQGLRTHDLRGLLHESQSLSRFARPRSQIAATRRFACSLQQYKFRSSTEFCIPYAQARKVNPTGQRTAVGCRCLDLDGGATRR